MTTSRARIALIVAMATNRVIGRDGDLPWRISADLKHFKATTMGKPIVMGRRTFASIGRALPGRANIVITRNQDFAADGVDVAHDVDGALAVARRRAAEAKADEIMIIGGAAIYEAFLPLADRLYLTEVHEPIDGDTYFPDFDRAGWREVAREDRDDVHSAPVSFVTLDRRAD
ncbi:MAG: dihydrofolate reductase [Pseudomonadota bacterium]